MLIYLTRGRLDPILLPKHIRNLRIRAQRIKKKFHCGDRVRKTIAETKISGNV